MTLRRKIQCSLNKELCSPKNKKTNKNTLSSAKPNVNLMQSVVLLDIPVMMRYPPCCITGLEIGNCINCNNNREDLNHRNDNDQFHNPGR